jgi:non-ribosomal peptide synthetase component E (peptide arylation enzyme)
LLWGLINSMQLVMTLPLVDVSLPANVQQVFYMINGLVNF